MASEGINLEAVKALAKDLTREFPRSPRETFADFVIAPRILDKCRAVLSGTHGEYNYDCFMDNLFFEFTGITAPAFQDFVATGASDQAVAEWIREQSKVKDRAEIIQWSNAWRDKRLSDMPIEVQIFMEDYIAANVPKHRPVYHVFDVFDLEEKRL